MQENLSNEPKNKKIKLDFKDSKYATGRRKKSIARVWVKKGSGNIYVNGKKMIDYFKIPNLQIAVSDKEGEISFLDRSWYTRAITEPIMGYCTENQYRLFMKKVNGWEKKLIDEGVAMLRDDKDADAAVTVSVYNMWSPTRARKKRAFGGHIQVVAQPNRV